MTRAVRLVLASSMVATPACFSPDEDDDEESSVTAATIATGPDTSGPQPTDADADATATEEDPTTADDSSDGAPSETSTGECTFQGCYCITDSDCDDGLVCRVDSCQPLECGDGMVEGTELCDDENDVDGDGCDADCTFTELVAVDAAYQTTCVLMEGGRVRCWGANYTGQLGQGNTDALGDDESALEIPDVMLPMGALALSSGDAHSCVRLADDSAICWGGGGAGQLGQIAVDNVGDDEFPSVLPAIVVGGSVEQVAAGGAHSCARLASGTLRCWGAANSGQLGYGNTNQIGDDEAPNDAGTVPIGSAALDLSNGVNHTCAVLSNGTVRCWGQGPGGALGYGTPDNVGDDEPADAVAPLDFGEAATLVSCGFVQSCALFESGAVRCWGANGSGELGQANTTPVGDDEPATTLVPIDLAGTATAITAGDNHACAVLDDGSVRCWGNNAAGQLGLGHVMNVGDDEAPSAAAVLDFGGGQPNQVEAGGAHT
jgi:cysteine-rich repeat protein